MISFPNRSTCAITRTTGWGLLQWHNRRLVSHTGGTDGFSSQVAFMPEDKLGFVLLCNVPDSELIKEVRGIVWGNLLDIH